MKAATSVIALSRLANVVLLIVLLTRPAAIEETSKLSNMRAPAPAIVDQNSTTFVIEDYYRELVAAGLSDELMKPLVLEEPTTTTTWSNRRRWLAIAIDLEMGK